MSDLLITYHSSLTMENLEFYYDRYWQEKDDSIDRKRVKFVVDQIQPDEKVLDIGCGC